jgi:hypothetical protein
LGRVGGDLLDAEFFEGASELSGRLFSGELFGEGPVGIVALEDGVAVAVEAEGNAVGGDHGVQGAQIADSIFGFELEVSGQDLAGGVVLKADEVRVGPRPSSQSWRLASVSAIMPKRGRGGRRERYLRGRRFCGEASLAARRMRRTVSRLSVRPSSAQSFSVR